MLLRLWTKSFDCLKSREARKAWDEIAKKMNNNFGTKRSTDEYRRKMKCMYLVNRYKQAKDWNSQQSGGNWRKSTRYDEIDEVLGCRDIVTLQNVQEAGQTKQVPLQVLNATMMLEQQARRKQDWFGGWTVGLNILQLWHCQKIASVFCRPSLTACQFSCLPSPWV